MRLIIIFASLQITAAFVTRPQATRVSTEAYGFFGRFRKQRKIEQVPPIESGDTLPGADVEVLNADSTSEVVSINEYLGKYSKAVLVGMPGAFTPTCSKEHLPGYIDAVPKLKSLGIEKVAIVTTNDRFVNDAWSENSGLDKSEITVLCDGDGDFVKKIGLADDMGFGIGVRSKRFVLLTENGKVSYVVTDEGMENCSATSAESLINYLAPPETKEAPAFDLTLIGAGLLAAATLIGATQFSLSPSTTGSSTTSTSTQRVQPAKSRSDSTAFSLLKEFRET